MKFARARALLENARQPLFFFDNDADGLCSALLLYRHYQKGQCFVLNASAHETAMMVERKIDEYQPDVLVFLDKAELSEDIISLPLPILWIDHHEVQQVPNHVEYINPRIENDTDNRPTTHWAYEMIGRPQELLWIAGIGIIADWQLTDVHNEFAKHYATLLGTATTAPQIMFTTPIGTVIRLLTFNMYGKSSDVRKAIKICTRIESIQEILDGQTVQSRYLHKRFEKFDQEYQQLFTNIMKTADVTDRHIIYTYKDNKTSFTAYLSNQLLFEHPGKLIVIARQKENTYRCSLRITPPYDLAKALAYVCAQYPCEGGGHTQACGARIPSAVFSEVLTALEQELFSTDEKTKE